MESFSIELANQAYQDIQDIYAYIAIELGEPLVAMGQIERVESAIGSLSSMPERVPLVLDECLSSMGYRKLLIDNYFVFFRVNTEKRILSIIRVLYARSDWQSVV